MSVTRDDGGRAVIILTIVAAVGSMLLTAGTFDAALAQTGPFGMPRPASPAPPPADGVIGWIFAKQAEFYREISRTIRAAKSDGSAVWTLLAISFAYGVFHAAGPGHGKAVISSYLVANEETWRRGIVLSFASALLQAFVAVTISFEAIEGGPMEDVEAVGNLRAATAVFYFSGGAWHTDGRAIFNLNPTEAIAYCQDFEMVAHELAQRR